jgi:hypothetical protein
MAARAQTRSSCRQPRRERAFRRLNGDWLERRLAPAGLPFTSSVALRFGPTAETSLSHFLATPTEVDLYSVNLLAGEEIDVAIAAQSAGSPLVSLLSVYNSSAARLAFDNQEGGDPSLDFQATTAGTYYIAVNSAPTARANPSTSSSATAAGSTGLYTLTARLLAPPLLPDLTGSSFSTGLDMAQAGEQVPVSFTVENRGGADPGNFEVQLFLSPTNVISSSAVLLATYTRGQLAAAANGRDFTAPSGASVTVPAGFTTGQAVIAMRVVADPAVPEAGSGDKSGVHRGADWEFLTVVAANPAGATNLSAADPAINTESHGVLSVSSPVSVYAFTVTSGQGQGQFEAELTTATAGFASRLTLADASGMTLLESDSGQIIDSLIPGTYLLSVARISGAGSYRLTTSFVSTANPFAPLPAGAGTATVATGDLSGDGFNDIVIGNRVDDTVTVYMNLGDGSFALPKTYAIGPRVWKMTVADATGDGRLDILSANKGGNSVSLLVNNGDGTFAPQEIIPVGTRPGGVAVADLNGDGLPDLVVNAYADDTVWVLLGKGNGQFDSPEIYDQSTGPGFAGPGAPAIADINGDGIPDLLEADYVAADVTVRIGNGDGTFGPLMTFPAQYGAYTVAAADLNGDGHPDLVVGNAVANSVSVLLGNGNGTFQPQKVYPVGFDPYTLTLAQFTGDGAVDIATANRGDNTVSVLLGKGDGTFLPESVFPSGSAPRGIAVGDFNRDGNVDIVNTNQGDDSATILWGNGDGTFASPQAQASPAPTLRPFQVVVADLVKNGPPAIITADRSDNSVSVLLANADGSFQTRETYPTGRLPISIAVGDLNGDGVEDIVTANYGGDQVSVLLGKGNGTFQPYFDLPAGSDTYDVKLADLSGDGRLDIVVTNKNDNTVGVILNQGGGKFAPMVAYPVASGPYEVAVDDLLGNGIPDLVVSHFSATVVDVLFGNGNGTFQPAVEFPVGSRPYGLALADLNGDGLPDIVTSDYRDNEVSVLLNQGNGQFGAPEIYKVGKGPNEVQVADLNGDGIPDIVTADYGSDSVSVLTGIGNGTFQPAQAFGAGDGPASLYIADLNGDGTPDVVVGSRNGNTVGILFGLGNGTFKAPQFFGGGPKTYSAAAADLTGDGNLDVVTTNVNQSSVTVHLGNGDGSFAPGAMLTVGLAPTSVAIGDLNGDGRPDIVSTNSESDSVSVLLGNGDGTFSVEQTFAVGDSPRDVAIADLNGDGIPDLIAANYNDDTISVLIGKGDGTFFPQEIFSAGPKPYAIAIADLNGDGRADVIVADAAGDDVSVLLNLGGTRSDARLGAPLSFATGRDPVALAVGDINGDGKPDIVTANAYDGTISVLMGIGNGTFAPALSFAVGARPYSVALADLTGDGRLDVVTSDYSDNNVSVLVNLGIGALAPPKTFATGSQPIQALIGDFNGDGRPDLATVSNHDATIGVLLDSGDGSFKPAPAGSGVGLSDTPLEGDFNGDGLLDTVVLDQSGDILFRAGLPGSSGAFAPPEILNSGRPARAITAVEIGNRMAIAAADAHYDPTLSAAAGKFVFAVSIYSIAPSNVVSRAVAFETPELPTSLAAAPLAPNGNFALIAAEAIDNTVSIAFQIAPGVFSAPLTVPAGTAPSAIAVGDFNDDGLPDIAVTDQASGLITVLLNDPAHDFRQSLQFQAGTGLEGVITGPNSPLSSSFTQSVSLAAGFFAGGAHLDLVVLNQATHSFSLLLGDGAGGFSAPLPGLTTSTSDGFQINDRPIEIVAGNFTLGGDTDLAVLMEDTGAIWIYTGNANGTFTHSFSIPVGSEATGLAVVPGNRTGLENLLVGNRFGDVLVLVGRGDGTFQIQGSRVSISVVPDLLGPGQAGVLVGDQQNDRVTVQAPSANGTTYTPVETLGNGGSSSQTLAPGDVEWAFLDAGSSLPDAIVVGTGSNSVEVYRTVAITAGAPTFAALPQTYFVGTSPTSVTVADVNHDGIPDLLVADQGSNDVTVIFGARNPQGGWTGIPGPRLKSGGDGPIAVFATNPAGSSLPNLAIVNGGSGTITVLPAVGQGFFDDRSPQVLFNFGSAIVQPPTFVPGTSLAYAVTANGNLVQFNLNNPSTGVRLAFAAAGVQAAQALAGGDVVVALASGVVDLLVPSGATLVVGSQLEADGSSPALPSSIDVVARANGQFDVLVSSEGSDSISVFSVAAAVASGGVTPPTGGTSVPTPAAAQQPGSSPGALALLASTTNATSASATSASATSAATASTASVSATATSATGLSLGSFSSLGGGSAKGPGDAMLVSVEGNTYLSVPILNFGGEGEEAGAGEERMPWLSALHPVGDASALARFVTGLDEVLKNYRGGDDATQTDAVGPAHDPWSEDLFYQHLPNRSPTRSPDLDDPRTGTNPDPAPPDPRSPNRAANPQSEGASFPISAAEPAPASWIREILIGVLGLAWTIFMAPSFRQFGARSETGAPRRERQKRRGIVFSARKQKG